VRWEGLTRLLRAAANDDGSAAWHDRLTPDAWQVIRLAAIEARELGHPCIAEEHVLLGLLPPRQPGRRLAGSPRAGPANGTR
jgi:hypothetical protein